MTTNVPVTQEFRGQHGVTAEDYERVEGVLGRAPTYEELGVFSRMWSEHCGYRSSRLLLRHLPPAGPDVLQGTGENVGVIDAGDGIAVAVKIESRNHSSLIEPHHGAATGVGGIFRDMLATGARPIASLNSLRFGSVDHADTMRLFQRVVAGIGSYGNCAGVPTVGGEVYFDAGYNDNILVNLFAVGLLSHVRVSRARATAPGNSVIYVGAETGSSGIRAGSLPASAEVRATSQCPRPAVQVGDPFTGKRLMEACLELRGGDGVAAIQDMGAGGLTRSAVEMAGRAGAGIEIDLEAVPVRERGMTPYEILLSESQERLLVAVAAGHEQEVLDCCAKWDVCGAVVGRVSDDQRLRARWWGDEVVSIPIEPLTHPPTYRRPAAEPSRSDAQQRPGTETSGEREDYNLALEKLLASPNLCSREWIWGQYDYLVGSNTVVGPGGDAAVVRLKGTRRALALTVDCNSRYCAMDPYLGSVIAVAEAARNIVAAGARPVAVSDCLNFGSPERPEVMWQFHQTLHGLRDACVALDTPVVSGSVSFYNETDGRAIPPTPAIGMVGILDDVTHRLRPWFRAQGDAVVLLGCTREELEGSEYLAVVHNARFGVPPWIDLDAERRLHRVCIEAAREGCLRSAHDVADGGLAVALAECCMGGPGEPLGVRCALDGGIPTAAFLFGESQSRMIVSVRRRHLGQLRELANREGVPVSVLGEVRGNHLVIGDVLDADLERLRVAWREGLSRRLAAGGIAG